MRTVKLIKDIVIEEVQCTGDHMELAYTNPQYISVVFDAKQTTYITPTKDIGKEKIIVPVYKFGRFKTTNPCNNVDITKLNEIEEEYIAYNPAIQSSLSTYIEGICNSKDWYKEEYDLIFEDRNRLLVKIKNSTFLKRLKYLFTGKLDD